MPYRILPSVQVYEGIVAGMARAFFAAAYAEQAEECGQPLHGEIMDQIPTAYDAAAWVAARTLAFDLARSQDKRLEDVYTAGTGGLAPREWGHYAAMQAMGSGVGLRDYDIALRVPTIEFGAYSLALDYFTSDEDDALG